MSGVRPKLIEVALPLAAINKAASREKSIRQTLDGEEAELDTDTRFALSWFAQHGHRLGPSGDADSVARVKNTSLAGIEQSGIGEAREGKFRLFERSELAPDWSPIDDPASPSGRCCNTSSLPWRNQRPKPRNCCTLSAVTATGPVNSLMCYTRKPTTRAGPQKPAPTTPSSRHGPT